MAESLAVGTAREFLAVGRDGVATDRRKFGDCGKWCCERGLNSWPPPYQGGALPLSYRSKTPAAAGRGGDIARKGLNEKPLSPLVYRPVLTPPDPPLWSRAMQKDAPRSENPRPADDRPEEALKPPPGPPKGGKDAKEARLASALRENLRRRKAAQRKETD